MAAPSASELAHAAAFKRNAGDKIIVGEKMATWLMDSFARNHMTDDEGLLINIVPVNNLVVGVGNGRVLPVRGIGSVITEDVVLSNVWYVPGIHTNLVSVYQLTTDHDLMIKIAGTRCHVTKMSDGSEVGRAHLRSDYKYEVDSLIVGQN